MASNVQLIWQVNIYGRARVRRRAEVATSVNVHRGRSLQPGKRTLIASRNLPSNRHRRRQTTTTVRLDFAGGRQIPDAF
jgi:hypothetical protein